MSRDLVDICEAPTKPLASVAKNVHAAPREVERFVRGNAARMAGRLCRKRVIDRACCDLSCRRCGSSANRRMDYEGALVSDVRRLLEVYGASAHLQELDLSLYTLISIDHVPE